MVECRVIGAVRLDVKLWLRGDADHMPVGKWEAASRIFLTASITATCGHAIRQSDKTGQRLVQAGPALGLSKTACGLVAQLLTDV